MFREADRNRAFKTLATIERVERTDWHRSHHDMLLGVIGQLKSLTGVQQRIEQELCKLGAGIEHRQDEDRAAISGWISGIEQGQSVLKADLDALRDKAEERWSYLTGILEGLSKRIDGSTKKQRNFVNTCPNCGAQEHNGIITHQHPCSAKSAKKRSKKP